jgi:hypothetical protein
MLSYLFHWIFNFSLPLLIIFLLSRDPYFNPRKSWSLILSSAIATQALVSLFIQSLLPLNPFIPGILLALFWLWLNINLFF